MKQFKNIKELKPGMSCTYLHYSDREAGNDPSEKKVKIKAVQKTKVGYDLVVVIDGDERKLVSVAGSDGKFGDDCEFVKESCHEFMKVLQILQS